MNKFIADIYCSAAEDVKCHKYCSNYWMGNAKCKYKTMATFAFDFKNYYINFKKKHTIVSPIPILFYFIECLLINDIITITGYSIKVQMVI